jgi:hypothetical protein
MLEFKARVCILRYWKRELNASLALGANRYKISFHACYIEKESVIS